VFGSVAGSPPPRGALGGTGITRSGSPLFRTWDAEADSSTESERSVYSAIDPYSQFDHATIVAFGNFSHSEPVGINYFNANDRINEIKEHFQIPGPAVVFDHAISVCGRVDPGQAPQIGSAAFSDRVQYPGLGPITQLDPEIVDLHVALTIAHEQSHFRQFEQYPTINLVGHDDLMRRLLPNQSTRIQQAALDQTRIFEFLAYQSEIRNIQQFNRANPELFIEKNNQIRALLDISTSMRDDFYNQMNPNLREQVGRGQIEEALSIIRTGVPNILIRQPTL
jgi:hypothetical protein